jgi:6-phosphofructokinase 1
MGRRAGWLAYAAAVAGEAHLVVGVEDVSGPLRTVDGWLDVPGLVSRIVDVIAAREAKGKRYALVVLAEGLVELLPPTHREGLQGDRSGPWGMGSLQIGRLVAAAVASAFEERFWRPKKVTGLQIGYETRCAQPHAFDVLLGCQLGVGASRALTELELDAVMVSTSGQLDLRYVPFDEIVDPATFRTEVRYVGLDSDFRRMVQMMGTRVPTARKVEP